MAMTRAGITPAIIEMGRILDVNIATYTVSVTTQYSKKPQTGIAFATPYQHMNNGEGIYFMPEVGSVCWICFPSDGNRPFVLAWAAASEEGDFRARKMDLNPGDIVLSTRDENFAILRRGGVVQIGSNGLCQRIFLPVNNTIRDFCENYGLHSLAGDLEWSVGRTENTTEGHRPARMRLHAREFADDPKPVAVLEMGSQGEGSDQVFTLSIRSSGAQDASERITLNLTKEGSVSWRVERDVHWGVSGKYELEVRGNLSLKSGQRFRMEGDSFEMQGKTSVLLKCLSGDLTFEAPRVVVDSTMMVGSEPEPLVKAPALLTWLATHSHLDSTGAPTGVPIIPPPGGEITSKTVFGS
jgi:hypothetical protein